MATSTRERREAAPSSQGAGASQRAVRMLARTRAITLEVILRAVFGAQAREMDSLRAAIAGLLEPMHTLTFLRAALSRPSSGRPEGALGGALDRLDAAVYAHIAER